MVPRPPIRVVATQGWVCALDCGKVCVGFCPCARARALGFDVVFERLPGGVWGQFDGAQIRISPDLSFRHRRASVAHELVHAERGDRGEVLRSARQSVFDERAMERDVDEVAARALLPLYELADVLVLAGTELDVAEVMEVDVETVRARLDTLTAAERDYLCRRLEHRVTDLPAGLECLAEPNGGAA